jgi:hypothetical protein
MQRDLLFPCGELKSWILETVTEEAKSGENGCTWARRHDTLALPTKVNIPTSKPQTYMDEAQLKSNIIFT